MTNFIPNDEQLFDYFLRQTDPALTRQIEAYLKDHPLDAARLNDFSVLESGFAKLPQAEPSEAVLRAVLANAEKQIRKPVFSFENFFVFFRQRTAMSFALVAMIAVGLYLQVRGMPVNSGNSVSGSVPFGDSSLTATFQNGPTTDGDLAKAVDDKLSSGDVVTQDIELRQKYQRAVSLYQSGEYKNAADLFGAVIATKPDFDQKRELYTYWVDALEKDGQSVLAVEKRKILESFPSE